MFPVGLLVTGQQVIFNWQFIGWDLRNIGSE
jgi:hypothetical protein